MTGEADPAAPAAEPRARIWLAALLPIGLLIAFVALFVVLDPLRSLVTGAVPGEDLTFDRIVVREAPHDLVATVVNGGTTPVTIAQVTIDDAFWMHTVEPGRTVAPLGSVTVTIPYPWVWGEPLQIGVVTSAGLVFRHELLAAIPTPQPSAGSLLQLALLGIGVGLVPVLIGVSWYAFVRRARRDVIDFLLAFTGGLLAFIAIEATDEALELTSAVPTALGGVELFALSVVGALAILLVVGDRLGRGPGRQSSVVAMLIAVGIGLHNLGEGLAIAAAFSIGQLGLTTLLVVGFAIHNSTEGLAIVVPLARDRPRPLQLLALGAIAGLPTVLGTLAGGWLYSPALAVVAFGVGVGAILQVLWALLGLIRRGGRLRAPLAVAGVGLGIAVMYVTSLIIVL